MVEEAAADPWPACLDRPVSDRAGPYFEELVSRRAGGEPLQYVLGHWPFRHLDLLVDRRVLIPRPETEQVVEVALRELRGLRARQPAPAPAPVVVDLGTGSGAIALSVATEVGDAQVWATECSADALAAARANLAGIGSLAAARVRLVPGSWFEPLPDELRGRVQLVVSNPPYVAASERLPDEVAMWEPAGALIAGPTGLEAITEIIGRAPDWLGRPGVLVVELAPHQAGAARAIAASGYTDVEVQPDLAGRDRALVARLG
jgi:release factor glutamine methyltransferase